METRRVMRRVAVAAVLCMAFGTSVLPAGATSHPPTVKTCEPGTDCTAAVFAVCFPISTTTCVGPSGRGPRTVDVVVTGFTPGESVHVWWLMTEVTDPVQFDCSQALMSQAGVQRTHIADVTMDSYGDGTVSNVSLPPGNLGEDWLYGSNWVCATEAPHGGGAGNTADRLFSVYPA